MPCDDDYVDWRYIYKSRNGKDCQDSQKLEETRKDSSTEPLGRAWPSQHLGFRFLDPRTMKELISVVLNHPVSVN